MAKRSKSKPKSSSKSTGDSTPTPQADSGAPSSPGGSERRSVFDDGLLTGLVGAGVLAGWFFMLDFIREDAFFTPSLLAGVVFDGGSGSEVVISAKNVFAYTGLHVGLFLILGWATALMFREFEDNPLFGIAYLLCFAVFGIVLFGIEIAMMPQVIGVVGTWSVAVGNLAALIGMFWFLLRRYPDSFAYMAEAWRQD